MTDVALGGFNVSYCVYKQRDYHSDADVITYIDG